MPSLSKKDRVSLCLFTFSDGRRCRIPRVATHPHFCHYHAQKEAQALATQKLSNELAYFFSGSYLAACDLSTALSQPLRPATPANQPTHRATEPIRSPPGANREAHWLNHDPISCPRPDSKLL